MMKKGDLFSEVESEKDKYYSVGESLGEDEIVTDDICPKCGSHDIEKGAVIQETDMMYQRWICNNCPQCGEFVYEINFVGTQV